MFSTFLSVPYYYICIFHFILVGRQNLKAICSGCAIRVKSSEIMGKVCPRTTDGEKKKSKNRNCKVNMGCCWSWVLMLLVRWCSKIFLRLLCFYVHTYIFVISFREKRTDDGECDGMCILSLTVSIKDYYYYCFHRRYYPYHHDKSFSFSFAIFSVRMVMRIEIQSLAFY